MKLSFLYKLLLWIGVLLLSSNAIAQIQDDSSKQSYGYHSIRYTTENDVYMNQAYTRTLDSTLFSFQRYTSNFKNGYFQQDLGNWATPIYNFQPLNLSTLGVTNGYHTTDAFAYNADRIRYYNTRSPYTELQYYQGSRGQQSMEVNFARNINPQWNVGFDVRRVVSKKINGRITRNDRLAEYWVADVQASHLSKDKTRALLASFNHLYYQNYETGGIKPDSGDANKDLFDYYIERVWLNKTRTLDRRYQYRLYAHQALVGQEKVQLFMKLDHTRQTNRYDDIDSSNNAVFYDTTFGWTMGKKLIADRTNFNSTDARAGIKGTIGKFFYATYVQQRHLERQSKVWDSIAYPKTYDELYGAGQLEYRPNDSLKVGAILEAGNNETYRVELYGKGKFWKFEILQLAKSPNSLQQRYVGGLQQWDNSFVNQQMTQVHVGLQWQNHFFRIEPYVRWTQYQDLIYLGKNALMSQADEKVNHTQAGVDLHLKVWKKFNVHHISTYQNVSDTSILRIPTWTNATQVYWESWLFKKATLVQFGFDVWHRSSYMGYMYNPLMQQYYVSSGDNPLHQMPMMISTDVFVNLQIRKTRIFVKLSNALQGVLQDGYFTTPYYTGLPRSLDFGISWKFFD
ncbi:MAG: putative porin [Cytophagaceae bacterium]